MNITVTTDSKTLERAFKKAPAHVTRELRNWVSRTAFRTERAAKKRVPPRVDTGRTQSSIQVRNKGIEAEVKPTAKHAYWVHEGRSPGRRMPPFQPGTELNRWATKRGLSPFLVARAIGRKGTKPHRFMNQAYSDVKPSADRDAHNTLVDIVRAI